MYSKFFIPVFLFMSLVLASQEIDNKYLESLPESVRNDVLNRIDQQASEEDPIYRSSLSSSRIQKDIIKNNISINTKQRQDSNTLELFGADFFDTIQSSFMPINEPNLDPSYVLDFGDILEIQFTGQKDLINNYAINRDGSINLPDIGRVMIAGLSLQSAEELIKFKVKETLLGTSVYISLVNIRDINILVSGNAFNPGIYTLNGNSNILHALSVAGGINKFGSYRKIELIRNNKVIENLDMYDVLINAKFLSRTRLKTGDIIFVNPVNNIISVDGAVSRPAKYELLPNQNLIDVLNYANGIKTNADRKNMFLERINDGRVKSMPIDDISMLKDIQAKDGDSLFIRKYPFRQVSISGAVLNPGSYMMSEGDTINDLIKKSGGYTKNAYPFGAVYENETAKLISEMSKEILYEEFIDNIITIQQQNPTGDFDLSSIINLMEDLKKMESTGRIIIDLNSDSNDSMVLVEGDRIMIPEKSNHIYIYGEVSSEGAVIFKNGNDLNYYINKSGGFRDNANKKAIYILHPNGVSQKFAAKRNIFQDNDKNLELYPGSIIFVPRKIDNSASNRLALQAYATILGNIGVSLASISVLKQ